MRLDFSKCQTPEDVERVMDAAHVKGIIASNRRVLLGFAHLDRGEKVEGCDCCYCAGEGPTDEG